jgi:ParB family chromosome partitioning protein
MPTSRQPRRRALAYRLLLSLVEEVPMQVVRVPCDAIRPDPDRPSDAGDDVTDLAESIRAQGLLRPILVRRSDDGYVIVHGERRWRAACMLGHANIVACLVLDVLHRSGGTL